MIAPGENSAPPIAATVPVVEELPRHGRIVILDFEYTAWEGSRARRWRGPGEHREVIQFGAVALDAASGLAEVGNFERLVKPRINPVLSSYITDLTGITNDDLARSGVDFATALGAFSDFVGATSLVCANGEDHRVMIENCILNTIAPPADMIIANLHPLLGRITGLPSAMLVSGELPTRLGFGTAADAVHNAVWDARAIGIVLRAFRRNGLV
jgi:inhibitor of KinA sporulation pathway (predicted exonuclease)